ncbi:MAG TPA: ethanolamine ammonia-lyase subunit EutC [Bryobacteraceae bacterium]|nr:ethanolamine ammonia-lyase subunit EutC [Bryobacteraceae bacterium]
MVTEDPWRRLRAFTPARIALGRAGNAIPTAELLAFQLAHAQARDAVHLPLDVAGTISQLQTRNLPSVSLHSAARDRLKYLLRPDLGRQLDQESRARLPQGRYDAVFIVADGLSALAVHRHAVCLLDAILPKLAGWQLAPVCVVEQGRVAIGDEIGERVGAALAVMLIGERPGLSAPDSLGVYLTYGPRVGATDAQRNCISNIREQGLSYGAAAERLFYLMTEARRRKLSGIGLKDDSRRQTSVGLLLQS